jgi:hypothetical protein
MEIKIFGMNLKDIDSNTLLSLLISGIIIFVIIIVIIIITLTQTVEPFTNYNSSCGNELLEKVMVDRNMTKDASNYDVYIPCTYNGSEREILKFQSQNNKKLFLLEGCDFLASKLALWDLLREEYKDDARKYMPPTFLLENKKDMDEFPIHFNNNKKNRSDQMYILKNYAQRQEGLKLTRDLKEIMDGIKNGWYLVQDYIYDPYLISGHKINLRYYLLIVCRNNKIESYIHNNGFVYYTPEKYNEYDISFKTNVTTGYIDRKIYDTNPLTLDDFRNHIETMKPGSRNLWNNNAKELMSKCMKAINKKVCKNTNLSQHVRFQLFGCDLAPDSKLNATLIEINKGPDLDAKDERDKQVKIKVQEDIFKIIEEDNTINNFIRLDA